MHISLIKNMLNKVDINSWASHLWISKWKIQTCQIVLQFTFKEILTVKKVIEKFKFHLIERHFLVEMDISTLSVMFNSKRTLVPHTQLFTWKNWSK